MAACVGLALCAARRLHTLPFTGAVPHVLQGASAHAAVASALACVSQSAHKWPLPCLALCEPKCLLCRCLAAREARRPQTAIAVPCLARAKAPATAACAGALPHALQGACNTSVFRRIASHEAMRLYTLVLQVCGATCHIRGLCRRVE